MKAGIIFSMLIFFTLQNPNLCAQTQPSDLQKKIEKSIRSARKSQEKAEAWARERTRILNEIREQKHKRRWLRHQKGKYETYIRKQQAAIAELERRKKETRAIDMSLEPFLDELLVRLEEFVKNDLPFLPEERQHRLRLLKDSLNDYHIGLAEKTRRVMEALQAEAGYGGTSEKTETVIELEGGPTQVSLFRMGRVALFYLSPDGKQVGWFSREKSAWVPLPAQYTREISRAMEIAEKKRTPALVDIPVGRSEQ